MNSIHDLVVTILEKRREINRKRRAEIEYERRFMEDDDRWDWEEEK